MPTPDYNNTNLPAPPPAEPKSELASEQKHRGGIGGHDGLRRIGTKPDSDDEDWTKVDSEDSPREETGAVEVKAEPEADEEMVAAEEPDEEAEPEAPEGIGIKVVTLPDELEAMGVEFVAKTTYDEDKEAEHELSYFACLDTSASMSGNGGGVALRQTMIHLPEFGARTDPKGPKNTLSGATFDASVGQTVRSEKDLRDCREFADRMVPLLHDRGGGTDIRQAVGGALNDLQSRAKAMPQAHRDKTVFTVVMATDGRANPPVDASELRDAVKKAEKESNIAVQICIISLGAETSAAFVTDVVGPGGLVGFAPSAGDAEEAFIKVFGSIQSSRGVFNARYNWVRVNTHNGEEDNIPGGAGVVQLGLVTKNHVVETGSIPLPPGGLKVGDKLEVACRGMKETMIFHGGASKTREDLWTQMGVIKDVRAVQHETTRRDVGAQATMDAYAALAARTKATPGASRSLREATAAMDAAVFRSLSAPASADPNPGANGDYDHDLYGDGGDAAPQYRSLGGMGGPPTKPPAKRSCRNGRTGRGYDEPPPFPVQTQSAPHVAAQAASQGLW
jgi:hypothetical protein